ncbi:MAG: ABC transporter substrate-binding protein [Syntrophus sp. (in: bacteria)]|nr:ABC transporter substrate-binding protein [Syntrophus sp. (in: bacteria)]
MCYCLMRKKRVSFMDMSISRQSYFIVLLWMLLCICLFFYESRPAQAEETLIFGHILDDSTAHHRNMVWAANEINRELKGRYRLQVVPRGQLGTTDAQVIEGFKTGNVKMAYLSLGHLKELYPLMSIGAGPFVFRDFAHWQVFRDSSIYQELVAGFEKKTGMKALGLAYYGERHVTTKSPLVIPEGLNNLTVRVPNIPIIVLTFRALGAKPVPLPFKETYQALKEGIVEAQENPLPAINAMRFYEVTKVINLTAHISDAQLVVMDGKRWNSISPADQEILVRIFREASNRVTDEVRKEELQLVQDLPKLGAIIHPVDRRPMIERILPFQGNGYFPWTRELYDRIQSLH